MDNPRRRFALGAALLASIAGLRSAQAAEPRAKAGTPGSAPTAKQRVVIQVSNADTKTWGQALNYTENLQEIYGKDNVQLELVALGWGIGILKFDSPMADRVADAKTRGVNVLACQVTMRRQKLTPEDMLSDVGYVPAGLGQIIARQRQGWSYISG